MTIINKNVFIVSLILLLPACSIIDEQRKFTDQNGRETTTVKHGIAIDPSMGNLITRVIGFITGKPVTEQPQAAPVIPKIKPDMTTVVEDSPKPIAAPEVQDKSDCPPFNIIVKTPDSSVNIGC